MRGYHLDFLGKLVLLFVLYFSTARLGLSLDAVSGFATPVWPPTGIALAALLILGYRFWPGIAAAAFLVNLTTGAAPLVALGIGIGNMLEALIGAYLLRRFVHIDFSLERVRDIVGLVLTVIVSTSVSATIGVSTLLSGNVIVSAAYDETWIAWWIGDMLGALVITPLLLIVRSHLRSPIKTEVLIRSAVPFLFLVGACIFVFFGLPWLGVRPFGFVYTLFPFLIWIALLFSQRGSVAATFTVSLIAILGTVVTHTTRGGVALSHDLILLQSFIGVTAVTFMIMAAVVSEREKTQMKEHRLAQRTALLMKQRARLQALNRSKDEFISIASHQLRTPATAVKQYIGMLLDNYAGKVPDRQLHLLRTAYQSNELQLRIINDLLNVAQVDNGKFKLDKQKVDLTSLAADVIARQSAAFAVLNQTVNYMPGRKHLFVMADPIKLGMVLENILDNASKYSLPSKNIHVTLDRIAGNAVLSIKDEGTGIKAKDQGKLFKKFSRINNELSAEANGSGLGLYWAKKIIDAQGGSITVDSIFGQGSTFTITLPEDR
jgi:signal transduction histidine kinase